MTKARYSWGHYPNQPQTPHTSYWREDLPTKWHQLKEQYGSTLPFGQGRSYGDSCLAASNHIMDMSGLNRFISADWEKGIIVAEAGISLAEILSIIIPRGWFLPVTPGTQLVSLGGAIANDVHGKNHHKRGTFGRYVSRFELIRSDNTSLICSTTENTEIYAATIGGLGLTGIITWAEIQLIPIQSSQMEVTHRPFNSLDEFFSLSAELDEKHEYAVAWLDCLATGSNLGRGIYTVADHATQGALEVNKKSSLTFPFTPPLSLVNKLSVKVFNELYYYLHKQKQKTAYIDYALFFYPLDKIHHWNRIYGKKGFQQYQCVIPDNSAKTAISELLSIIAQNQSGSFLAVLKRCGSISSPGLLSFPIEGISLALDFPQSEELNTLFTQLDNIVRNAGGRLYPAKDAHMSASDFQAFYPTWKQLEKWKDPILDSHFWKRVTA